jgi:Protein of unknown function (DUF732)
MTAYSAEEPYAPTYDDPPTVPMRTPVRSVGVQMVAGAAAAAFGAVVVIALLHLPHESATPPHTVVVLPPITQTVTAAPPEPSTTIITVPSLVPLAIAPPVTRKTPPPTAIPSTTVPVVPTLPTPAIPVPYPIPPGVPTDPDSQFLSALAAHGWVTYSVRQTEHNGRMQCLFFVTHPGATVDDAAAALQNRYPGAVSIDQARLFVQLATAAYCPQDSAPGVPRIM